MKLNKHSHSLLALLFLTITACGGGSATNPDTTSPFIVLNGGNSIILSQGEEYIELGATGGDVIDGAVDVIITGNVDTNTLGVYVITYLATDSANNSSSTTRTITVILADTFITTWKTDNPGASDDNQISIGTSGTDYDYQVDWGDGLTDNNVTGDITHTYTSAGTYTVSITGNFSRIFFGDEYDNEKILSIERWGNRQWQSMNQAFYNCSNLVGNAPDLPDLSQVTDMSGMFSGAISFNQELSNWDVSAVTNMSEMFRGTNSFNQDLNNWDVSAVTDMSGMFDGANSFNQDLNNWDVSAVTNMNGMFYNSEFNQDLNNWDVSNVTMMNGMFAVYSSFNQDLSSWDVSAVTSMSNMFYLNTSFNQDLSNWDVSAVTDMSAMFSETHSFNQDLSNWDVSAVTDMTVMFIGADSFNQNLSNWDVSAVTDMSGMFLDAGTFNQDLSSWDVSAVTDMSSMFAAASAFNQDLGNWDVSAVNDMFGMFASATLFNQDLSNWNVSAVTRMTGMFNEVTLSTANYDALLTGWSVQPLQNDVIFSAGNSTYSASSEGARDTLRDVYNWTVTDGGIE